MTFVETVLELSVNFPNCRRWLRWWLQPSVSSMIFKYSSKTKPSLAAHPMRTSNSVEAFHKESFQDIAKKDEELMFDTAISSEEDLIYDEISLLTPLGAIVNDPERHDTTSEDMGELIPTEYDAVLCNHQNSNCIRMWTRQTDVSKTDVPLEDDYILPDVTDDNDEIVNQSNLNAFLVGYKQQSLLLNRNASNSCYIDAPLELLLRSVLPYIKISFFKNCDFNNSFDNDLFAAFQHYEEGNSIIGNQLIRNFVWAEGTPFVIDQMDDSYFFLE
ncbi:hypothetical protein [Parasitella parasitica]|uniref:Uncharacterized protein n=1 Tax=Parasitella parasitica TaxID=35722 RepID=A0A0B7MRQ0_9FUNG|nr:hypothetical protein [Parasitella parasitica]